ncbi:hypothetical protein F5883DRAFT_406392 [Diaporthe sp. PMI_573]|nr:hypothetical protein F5883DRAFT_406392 [Diaporthaceae sp. PMI_573]
MSYAAPLLELPLHLVSATLSQLDSMQSLGSAILSHSLLYHSFCDDKKYIVRCIVRNQIPSELIHYAEAAFKAKYVDNDRFRDARTLLESAFKRVEINHNHVLATDSGQDAQPYGSMDTISIASAISKTHWLVEYFCRSFIRERLPLMRELMGGPFDPEGVCQSQAELFRIRRALYRYQIYCNLVFRRKTDFHPGRWVRQTRNSYLQQHFFHPFPPWVNEQLCCIHDYLEDVLSRSFDDVAAHDVDWGASSVDWLAQGRRNEHKQALVSALCLYDPPRTTAGWYLIGNCSLHTGCLSSLSLKSVEAMSIAFEFYSRKVSPAPQ